MKLFKNRKRKYEWAIYISLGANGIRQPWNYVEIQEEGNGSSKLKNVKKR